MRQIERILQDFAANISIRLNNRKQLNYSLLGGDLGDIIFLYHYSRIDAHYESIAEDLLEKMLRSLSLQPRVATYCKGLAGLGVGLLTLQQDEFISGVDSALGAIDPVISLSLESFIEDNNIDFLHGLIGIGFYLLEKQKTMRFDVVISFDAKDRKAVCREVTENVQKEFPDYQLQVTMDTDYAEE